MKLRLIIFVIIVAALTNNCYATTYYIHPNGSNANSGTGSDTANAWQSLYMGSKTTFVAGDNIKLAKGGVWDITGASQNLTIRSSGTTTSPIIFSSYDSDLSTTEKPWIQGDFSGNGSSCVYINNRDNIVIEELKTTFGNTGTDYCGNIRIHGGDNILVNNCYMGSSSSFGFYAFTVGSITVLNCDAEHNIIDGYCFRLGTDTSVINSTSMWNDRDGIRFVGITGMYAGSNTCRYNGNAHTPNVGTGSDQPDGSGIYIGSVNAAALGKNYLIENNILSDNIGCGLDVEGSRGYLPTIYGTVTNNIVNKNGEAGIQHQWHCREYYIADNTITNTGTINAKMLWGNNNNNPGTRLPYWGTAIQNITSGAGSLGTWTGNAIVEHNIIDTVYDNGRGDGIGLRFDDDVRNIVYRYNSVRNCEGPGIKATTGDYSTTTTNLAYYNLVIQSGYNSHSYLPGSTTGQSHPRSIYGFPEPTCRDSWFFNNTGYGGNTGTVTPYAISYDNHLYENRNRRAFNTIFWPLSEGAIWQGYGTGTDSLAGYEYHNLFATTTTRVYYWGAGTHTVLHDVSVEPSNIIATNPNFIDPLNENYHLQWNSPCIDAGTITANILGRDASGNQSPIPQVDYDGNPIYGIPDMGCFEYQPPFAIGTHTIDITGTATLYADGKWRYKTGTSSGAIAALDIYPTAGRLSGTYSAWMDIDVGTWTVASMTWVVTPQWATDTTQVVAGLDNYCYESWYTKAGGARTFIATHTAYAGSITSNYTGGMGTTILFEIVNIPLSQVPGYSRRY